MKNLDKISFVYVFVLRATTYGIDDCLQLLALQFTSLQPQQPPFGYHSHSPFFLLLLHLSSRMRLYLRALYQQKALTSQSIGISPSIAQAKPRDSGIFKEV